jgi:hypothetical protein
VRAVNVYLELLRSCNRCNAYKLEITLLAGVRVSVTMALLLFVATRHCHYYIIERFIVYFLCLIPTSATKVSEASACYFQYYYYYYYYHYYYYYYYYPSLFFFYYCASLSKLLFDFIVN